MEIVVIGNESSLEECRAKFGETNNYQRSPDQLQAIKFFKPGSVVFDFCPKDISIYQNFNNVFFFLNSTEATLSQLIPRNQVSNNLFGFCGMPSFLNREVLETTILRNESQFLLEKVCSELGTKYKVVEDRVGMITPRIICMIINEAYFAIEENVASRTDIDLAMKLGTNYPFGPFEWCDKIGIKNVYSLLMAVRDSSGDERYKICELLTKESNSLS